MIYKVLKKGVQGDPTELIGTLVDLSEALKNLLHSKHRIRLNAQNILKNPPKHHIREKSMSIL